jgi:hypothetical protein
MLYLKLFVDFVFFVAMILHWDPTKMEMRP